MSFLKSLLAWEGFDPEVARGFQMIVIDGDPRATRIRLPFLWKRQAVLRVDPETARSGYFVGFYAYEGKFAQIKRERRHDLMFRMRIGPGKVGFFVVHAGADSMPAPLHLEDVLDKGALAGPQHAAPLH